MDYLFVYGTLKDPELRKQLTGKYFNSSFGRLRKFISSEIVIEGISYPIIEYTGKSINFVDGEFFVVNDNDLKIFDIYEGDEYRRIKVVLEDSNEVWIYCK